MYLGLATRQKLFLLVLFSNESETCPGSEGIVVEHTQIKLLSESFRDMKIFSYNAKNININIANCIFMHKVR